MKTYYVLESEVGSISLCVSDGAEVIYIHTGYQHNAPEQLRLDLEALSRGADPRTWDGNELITKHRITNKGRELPFGKLRPEEQFCNLNNQHIKSKIIYTQDGPIKENMGAAGKRAFAI
jgi:hypothetical protein